MANKISVVIDVVTTGANRAVGDFKRAITDADGAIGKMKAGFGSAMTTVKANAGTAALAVGAAMFKVGKDSVSAASELEQSVGGVEKAYGEAAAAVLEIGKNAEETMGLSERAFNEGALSLSAFAEDIARDTGQPVEQVLADLMTRAADFSAAFGVSVSEAVRIFSSTLSGESEPIKKFGIIINETETKAYAAEAGIEDMGKAAQRAGLLMQDTSKFAGQFGEESDTLAGRQERLKAKIENIQAALGEGLLPVVADGVGLLTDFADGVGAVSEKTGGWADKLGPANNLFSVTKGLWDKGPGSLLKMATGYEPVIEASKNLGEEYIANQRGFEAWEKSVKESKAKDVYVEHAKGMQLEAKRVAEENEAATARIELAWDDLNRELSDRSAYLDIEDALAGVEEAYVAAMDTADKSLSEQEADARNLERSVIDLKGKVFEYAQEIAGLPLETATEIDALIDEGAFAEVERRLATLEKIRIARITPETYVPQVQSRGGGVRYGATGGIVTKPTLAVIGEAGPEAVLPLDGAPGASPLPGGLSGGGTTINVTVNAGLGADGGAIGDAIVRELRQVVRRNGPIQGIT